MTLMRNQSRKQPVTIQSEMHPNYLPGTARPIKDSIQSKT